MQHKNKYDLSEFLKEDDEIDNVQANAAPKKKYDLSEFNTDDNVKGILEKKSSGTLSKELEHWTPLDLVKAGLLGLGEGGQNINRAMTKGANVLADFGLNQIKPGLGKGNTFPLPSQIDFKKLLSTRENPSMLEKGIESTLQFGPLLAAGPLGLAGDVAAGAGYSALQSPGSEGKGAAIGGGTSGAFNILNQIMQSSNPIIRAGARAAAGAGVGYGLGGASGAAQGAGAGIAFPTVARKLGFMEGKPGLPIVEKTTAGEALPRAVAGNELGTPLTPGEASARPDITAMEAGIGRTGEGASERVRIGQERINQQRNAINDLYKTISPNEKVASFEVRKAAQDSIAQMEKARQEAVDPFYEIAYEQKVSPNLIKSLTSSDRNIADALHEAKNDPKYQVEGELLNVPDNSIKMLDYAKRKLDAKIQQAQNFGDNDAVRVLTASKKKLLKSIERFSPDYKKAREVYSKLSEPIEEVENSKIGQIARLKDVNLKTVSKNIFDPSQTDITVLKQIKEHVQQQNPEAWDMIVKNEINRLMTQGKNKGITGRSFFDNVLSNDNRFRQFQVALEHNPQALMKLNNMKQAWEHLINMETPRTAAGQAKTSMSKARESVQAIVDMYNDMIGGEKQIQTLKYLYSPKWQADLIKIHNLPKKEQKPMLMYLLGKSIAPAYLSSGKNKEET